MAQNTEVLLKTRHFSRADCTALRAYLNKVPLATIMNLYYTEDDLEAMRCQSGPAMLGYLEAMRDALVLRASDANPGLAHSLQHAREKFIWSRMAIDYLIHAADTDSRPKDTDYCSMWFRPKTAERFKAEGILLISDLVRYINARGKSWYLPIPGMGEGRAAVIVDWLQRHPDVGLVRDLASSAPTRDVVLVEPGSTTRVPLERMRVPAAVSGAQGPNRYVGLCMIRSQTDIEAIKAFQMRYFERPKTLRAYTKEIERFYLWLVSQNKSLPACFYEDCIAYMQFLAKIPDDWIGPRRGRGDANWRPFAGQLSPKSQAYSALVLRMFFAWLVGVRYLGADPWLSVPKFALIDEDQSMQIDKALPSDLWVKIASPGGTLDRLCALDAETLKERFHLRGWMARTDLGLQLRAGRVALLLMGNCGLRCEEVSRVLRNDLEALPKHEGVFQLRVLGKRRKRRMVPVTEAVLPALRAHWRDRGLPDALERPMEDAVYILSPLHTSPMQSQRTEGYTTSGVYNLTVATLKRLADDQTNDLLESEREILRTRAPHAFRHTFGRVSAEFAMPVDVLRDILGHRSIQTTSIYMQAEAERKTSEYVKMMQKMAGDLP